MDIESNNYITPGGYASHIRVDTHFACPIPNGITPEEGHHQCYRIEDVLCCSKNFRK